MKRKFMLFFTVLALIPCLAVLSAAADTSGIVIEESLGAYSVSYAGTEGTQYVLLIVKAGSNLDTMDVTSILYIDQAAATNGTVSFPGVRLKSTQNADVYIGGEGLNTPAASLLSEGGGITVAGVAVSGMVTLQGRDNTPKNGNIEVTLTSTSDSNIVYTTSSDPDGTYHFGAITPGAYTLKLTKGGFLSYTKKTLTIESETDIPPVTLKGGDIVVDGQVTFADLTRILSMYMVATSETEDLNADGQVTFADLSVLLSNYMERKTEEA